MAYSPYFDRKQQNRNSFQGETQRNGGNNPDGTIKQIVAKEIPAQYVDVAEQTIARISKTYEENKIITSTKIRKLFGLFIDLYNEIKRSGEEELTDDQMQVLTSARIRIVYECGREAAVKNFVNDACLLEYMKSIGRNRQKLMNFYSYFEALVAYHRFYFGNDDKKGGK